MRTPRIPAGLLLLLLQCFGVNVARAQDPSALLIYCPDPDGIQPGRLQIVGLLHVPNEDVITNFILQWTCGADPSDPENCGFIEENAELLPLGPDTLLTNEDKELSATNFSSETGGSDVIDLGPIVGPGVSFEELENSLTTRTYVGALGSGGPRTLRLVDRGDLSDDGVVNVEDVDVACDSGITIDAILPKAKLLGADATGDGDVDFADFVILANNFDNQNTTFSSGDFDCNNETQFADFVILANLFGQSSTAAVAVPEPSSFAFLAMGALLIGLAHRVAGDLS